MCKKQNFENLSLNNVSPIAVQTNSFVNITNISIGNKKKSFIDGKTDTISKTMRYTNIYYNQYINLQSEFIKIVILEYLKIKNNFI